MSLTRETLPLRTNRTRRQPGRVHTCPMHPEIRQDQPGNCPKCGMTLEPVLPAVGEDENKELLDFQRR